MNKKEILTPIIIVLVSILAVVVFAFFNKTEPLNVDEFAKCVAEQELTMYGAVWCAYCAQNKKAFGESFKYINYVECPDNIQLCIDNGINAYPTWTDKEGKKYEGAQGLKGIAEITGCPLPE
jgi:thioredoxin-related protein